MEEKILRKVRKEVEEKLKVLRELEDKMKVKVEEEDVFRKLCEKEENVCNIVRYEIVEKGFFLWVLGYI